MSSFLNPNNHQLILASQSPRRKALLESLGYSFKQRLKAVDESFPKDLKVTQIAEYLSKKKANAYLEDLKEKELLITSDTVVVLGKEILEKANDAKEAKIMLLMLSGKKHQVITGVCLSNIKKQQSFSVSTQVYFKTLSSTEIDHYIENYKPFDKAGAYGIQEWIGFIGVEKIEGSFYNVMGLPLKELYEAIINF